MVLRLLELYGSLKMVTAPAAGRRAVGVPAGGPFDADSFGTANALLGNDVGAPAVELTLAAVRFEVLRQGFVAWVGAGAWAGSRLLKAGDLVELEYPRAGARSYLSALGGFQVVSQLSAGSVLEGKVGSARELKLANSVGLGRDVRVYRGSHAERLDWGRFLNAEYEVLPDSNRLGTRFKSLSPTPHQVELASEPQDVGVIQMPPSGNPIMLGPDGPTIGGYPRVACVIGPDLRLVSQLRPGDRVRFQEVGREEGQQITSAQVCEAARLDELLRIQAGF